MYHFVKGNQGFPLNPCFFKLNKVQRCFFFRSLVQLIINLKTMKTRSQTKNEVKKVSNETKFEPIVLRSRVIQPAQKKQLPFEPIDFDDASECWRANKKHLGNGQFKYVCPFIKDDKQRCGKNVLKGCMTCRTH